jgi:uncharacterized phage-associated protein
MALLKLLYFADRQALLEHGMPITGDRMVSMPQGPVLSRILDFITWGKANNFRSSPWFDYVSEADGYDVRVVKEGDTDELSRYELRVLESIDRQFGKLDRFVLRDISHQLPEWQDPHWSSLPIDPADILRAADHPPSEIQRIAAEAEELWLFTVVQQRAKR